MTEIFKKIIFFGALASLLTPLIIKPGMYFPFNSPRSLFFMAIVQVILLSWIFLITFNKNYRPKINLVTITLTFFIISLILSTILSIDSYSSFWSSHERMMGLLMYLHLYFFFLVISSTFKSESDWIKILGFSSIIASVVSLVGIADNFGIINFGINLSRGSTLGNTSFMGSYLLINVFFAFYVFVREREWWRIFYAINFIIISLGVLLNPGGRAMKGSFLAGIIIFTLLYFAFAYRHKIINKISKGIILVGLVSIVFIGFMAFSEGNVVREKIMDLHGMTGRFAVWEKAWEGFRERPILGWGLESFEVVFLKNFNPEMFLESHGREVWFDRAHNVVFDKLVSVGFIGTILFFSIFISSLFILWKKYLKEKEIDFLMPFVFTSLFIAYFIQNLTVFDMISSYMLIFLSFAFISSVSFRNEKIEKIEKDFNYLFLLLLIPFFFSWNFFISQPYNASIYVSRSLSLNKTTEEKINYSQKGIEASFLGRDQIRRNFTEKFLDRHQEELEEVIIRVNQTGNLNDLNKLREKRELLDKKFNFIKDEIGKNIEKHPMSFKDFLYMGKIYNNYFDFYYLEPLIAAYSDQNEEMADFLNEAEGWALESQKYFKKALELSPTNPQVHWDYVEAVINEGKIQFIYGNKEKAEEKFRKAFNLSKEAIEIEPRISKSHLLSIKIARDLLGDDDLVNELTANLDNIISENQIKEEDVD